MPSRDQIIITTKSDMEAGIKRSAKAQGCTCDPDVIISKRGVPLHGSYFDVTIVHDDWCVLLQEIEIGERRQSKSRQRKGR